MHPALVVEFLQCLSGASQNPFDFGLGEVWTLFHQGKQGLSIVRIDQDATVCVAIYVHAQAASARELVLERFGHVEDGVGHGLADKRLALGSGQRSSASSETLALDCKGRDTLCQGEARVWLLGVPAEQLGLGVFPTRLAHQRRRHPDAGPAETARKIHRARRAMASRPAN